MRTRELSLRYSARADRRFRESVRERKIGEPDRALGSLCQKLGVGGEVSFETQRGAPNHHSHVVVIG